MKQLDGQLSMFDLLEESLFTKCVKMGSGFAQSKQRISEMVKNMSNKKELQEKLKKEYGTGGRSIDNGFLDYDPKGFRILTNKQEEKYSWPQVADEIVRLVSAGQYMG